MAERLIELRNVKKSYGSVYALGGVSLWADKGEVVGLIGDNGAGKSTLIKNSRRRSPAHKRRNSGAGQAGIGLERGALARGWHRNRVPGPRPCRAAVDRPQHLHGKPATNRFGFLDVGREFVKPGG